MRSNKMGWVVLGMMLPLFAACSGGGYGSGGSPTQPPVVQSGNANVAIADFSFAAQSLVVTAGSTVTWKNDGQATHTASSDGSEFDSGRLAAGASFSHTFNTKGTFTYHCAIHANMTGTITVQ